MGDPSVGPVGSKVAAWRRKIDGWMLIRQRKEEYYCKTLSSEQDGLVVATKNERRHSVLVRQNN
jgi:hypothetical protein